MVNQPPVLPSHALKFSHWRSSCNELRWFFSLSFAIGLLVSRRVSRNSKPNTMLMFLLLLSCPCRNETLPGSELSPGGVPPLQSSTGAGRGCPAKSQNGRDPAAAGENHGATRWSQGCPRRYCGEMRWSTQHRVHGRQPPLC